MVPPVVPLFPLRAVLFPGAPMALHVFEDRYKALVQRCLAMQDTFGVVLIREGEEVGGPAEPFGIGTEAHLAAVQPLDKGRYHLSVVGGRRFRIEEMLNGRPYPQARVAWFPPNGHEDGLQVRQLKETVRTLMVSYLDAASCLCEMPFSESWHEASPEEYSFLVAACLPLEPAEKQVLLEIDSTEVRLRREASLLMRLASSPCR